MRDNLQTALTCLNDWSSFLAFEKLTGALSHCSHAYRAVSICLVFGLVSAWRADHSDDDNKERTGQLLLDLNSKGFKSIQILGHGGSEVAAEPQPARAFFVCYDNEKDGKDALLSLCCKYNQPAVAASEHRQIRVFNADGRVEKMFNKLTMTPSHLKRVWAAMAGRQFTWLESGIFDASPFMCRLIFNSVGLLCDDVAIERVYRQAPELIRSRPLRV